MELDDVDGPLRLPDDRPLVTSGEAAQRILAAAGMHGFVGLEGSAPALLAWRLAQLKAPVLYVAPSLDAARRAHADLSFLTSGLPFGRKHDAAPEPALAPLLLTPSESNPYSEVHPDRRATMTRAATLFHIARGLPWEFLVTTADALVRRVMPRQLLREAGVEVKVAEDLDVTQVAERLSAAGYLRVPVVEDPGSFAVRGGLCDVWPPGLDLPLRIELEGDLVTSMRAFHPDDQRTLHELEQVWLPPAREFLLSDAASERARERMRSICDAVNYPSTKTRQLVDDVASGKAFFGADGYLPAFAELAPLASYLPQEAVVVVEDPVAVLQTLRGELEHAASAEAERAALPHFPLSELFCDEAALAEQLLSRRVATLARAGIAGSGGDQPLDALELVSPDAPTLATHDHADLQRAVKATRAEKGKSAGLDPLVRRLRAWREAGLLVCIAARATTQAERLGSLLSHREIAVEVRTDVAQSAAPDDPECVQIVVGDLARGLLAPAEGFVLVTEEEIFGQRAHRTAQRKRSPRAALEDLRALAPGDHVVHVEHGVGRYLGLDKKQIAGISVELLVVEYAGGDKLFLPVYRLNQIQKFSGGDATPRLDRLGGQSFAKTKAKVARRVRQMADELLKLYAERNAVKKNPLSPPDDDYAAFEATFPYEETRDQALAISEVMSDLSNERVMDRLVCGDVGFGKTEVAVRAAFRNAMTGHQVALLCPTTVLAQQHYNTFNQRFADYPVKVRALSRFQSKKEQTDTIKGLRDGSVDIVIGTHRLLSKDVHFKDLGLLVIDEEQRFGVTHKERIKQLRKSVDALTLSATPIPRTLQMAVGGLRDMSLITTAPIDRRAIRTITSCFDESLVREAVLRELSRGGQIFYVYNRVEGIYERAERLQRIVPEAKVVVGHGQLSEHALEKTMIDFVDGQYDILVATAIIESGLDIPRANTIIIDRADLFGLAQLYQLRGRVGRSSERAYCYLLVPPPSQLTEEARMRIEALERYSELGSGFHIATLDMELRGAGELLGAEQSGFAASVGFDLFCQMLEEATRELAGEVVTPEVDPELSLDVEALLPEDYIAEVGVRLSFYKRLASAADDQEVSDIALEMNDRFGGLPLAARHLVELMRLKTELRRLNALGLEASAKSVTLHLRDDTPLDPQKIGELIAKKGSPYKISPDGRLTRRLKETEAAESGLTLADRMMSELSGCLREDA